MRWKYFWNSRRPRRLFRKWVFDTTHEASSNLLMNPTQRYQILFCINRVNCLQFNIFNLPTCSLAVCSEVKGFFDSYSVSQLSNFFQGTTRIECLVKTHSIPGRPLPLPAVHSHIHSKQQPRPHIGPILSYFLHTPCFQLPFKTLVSTGYCFHVNGFADLSYVLSLPESIQPSTGMTSWRRLIPRV